MTIMRARRALASIGISLAAVAGTLTGTATPTQASEPPTKSVLQWCGTTYFSAYFATWLRTPLTPQSSQRLGWWHNQFPPSYHSDQHIEAYSNLLVLSTDCTKGVVIKVLAPAGIELRGYTRTRPVTSNLLTSVLFVRVSGAPAWVNVYAYSNRHIVGHAVLRV